MKNGNPRFTSNKFLNRIAILTRPIGRNEYLASQLEKIGWNVFCFPTIEIVPIETNYSDLPLPQNYDLVVFVSGRAAQVYLDFLKRKTNLKSWPISAKAATNGPSSAQVLRNSTWFHSDSTIFYPSPAFNCDSQALWEVLKKNEIKNWRVLLVRAMQGNEWLAIKLLKNGARVEEYYAYNRVRARWNEKNRRLILAANNEKKYPVWLLTSKESIFSIEDFISQNGLGFWWSQCDFIVIHRNLYDCIRNLLQPVGKIITCSPNEESVFSSFKKFGNPRNYYKLKEQ